MISGLVSIASLVLLLFTAPTLSLDLCDEGDCANHTDLEICRPFGNSNKIPLYLMGFFPCNTRVRARGLTVAAQMAIRAVERNDSILSNYSMRLSFNNTMCDRVSATRAFITQLGERDVRHMIIGPGCSNGAVTVAENAPFRSLTQISYTATSVILSDKRLFPTFIRTIPSDNASIATITAVVREYVWEQVAIITERSPLFSNLSVELTDALEAENVRVIRERLSLEAGVDNPAIVMQQLDTSGARIVILNVFEDTAREIFCIAYRRGMIYPEYLYISYYQNSEYWWTDPIRNVSAYPPPECTALELTFAIFRSLAIDYFPVPSSAEENASTDVGYSYPRQFWNDFLGNLSSLNYLRSEALRQAVYVYDAIWAAALALHNASQILKDGAVNGQSLSLEDFHYGRDDINRVILNSARSLKYQGVSGKVTFNQYGDREPTGQIYQYRYTVLIDPDNPPDPPLAPFARINLTSGSFVYEGGQSIEMVFPLPDGVPQATEENYIHPALFTVYTILACGGIIFAVCCLIFNLVFRKKQIIKLSSPYLNVIINIGAILIYVDVILFGIDENVASFYIVDINCQATIWLASVGFSLFFGTILAKTWRVYYIFRNVELKKKPLKDWVLFLIVAVTVALDIVFLITITVDDWRLRLERILLIRNGGDIPLIIDQCTSPASTYWLPVLLAYKGLFLIIGLWLAVRTYRVKIKELRDSKLIVACVIGTCVVSIVLTLITLLLPTNRNADYAVIGAFIMPLVTGVLFLLFVTRMIELIHDPSGAVQLTSATTGVTEETQMTSVYVPYDSDTQLDDKTTIAELKETIKSLHSQIKDQMKQRASKSSRVNERSSSALRERQHIQSHERTQNESNL